MTDVVLASKSPRRQELLRNLVEQFLVINTEVDEKVYSGEEPAEFVLRLAKEKALSAGERLAGSPGLDLLVIGADTIVVDGDEILGKPRDEEHARRILRQLNGKNHQVLSGIATYKVQDRKLSTRLVKTEVKMRSYTELEIQAYIDSGDPFDKAGAYAIQSPSFNPVPHHQDCYANVMGLPLCDLSVLMKEAGAEIHEFIAERCQDSIQFQCPVFKKRLSSEPD
jgi:septum formation protein